jgi:hypothetical protein
MSESNHTVDILDVLLRGQTVRQFHVQMMIQNPAIAAAQPQKLRIQLGLEALPQADHDYFAKTAAQHSR